MIKVLTPNDTKFNYDECEKLFNKYKIYIRDNQPFKDITENTYFYSFFDDKKHLGCIYYYYKNNRLFVNAFAHRHTHLKNIECLKKTFGWFKCDIYAETRNKTAILCLYRCGFKKEKNNIYKLERQAKNGG